MNTPRVFVIFPMVSMRKLQTDAFGASGSNATFLSLLFTGRRSLVFRAFLYGKGFHNDPAVPQTNLVDPASSHMLVSKIKPCMSQYKLLYGETANGSLKQL